MSLSVPPPNRSRASSTNIRPALTINTLQGRRRSSSLVLPLLQSEPSTPQVVQSHLEPSQLFASPESSQKHSMFAVIASGCLDLLHVPDRHSINWSTPSSPQSTVENEFVLPISASSQQTAFGDVFTEKDPPRTHAWWWRPPTVHAPILLVMLLFPLTTAVVLLSLYSLPISVAFPRTLPELAALGRELHAYSQSGPLHLAHVIGVVSVTAVWKHAWSIPGSVIWNVLAGALFHPVLATLLLSTLTTLGSIFATLLCTPLAPSLSRLFPRALHMTRIALEGESNLSTGEKSKSPTWARLSVLRLVGVVPWSGINIACGVCGVAISDCLLGAFIGCLPWTAVTCQIGDILQTVASTTSPSQQTVSSLLTSPEILVKLAFLSFLSLAPILGRERLRSLISASPSPQSNGSTLTQDERVSRWTWVQEWKIRLSSQSRTQREDNQLLEALIQEKSSLP
ncbi:snare associated Golgi protein-domain-containing protein [Suillus ampliporus]|nr:snare associated Golgi protein-domain-containing protein [Suillus ampliporus]